MKHIQEEIVTGIFTTVDEEVNDKDGHVPKLKLFLVEVKVMVDIVTTI